MKSNYDKTPRIHISKNKEECISGWENICKSINQEIEKKSISSITIAVDTYQGVDLNEVERAFQSFLLPHSLYQTHTVFKPEKEIKKMVYPDVTDDRIFGYMTSLEISDFFDSPKLQKFRSELKHSPSKINVVCGPGATLCAKADIIVYADMARWEIQQRMRKNEVGNIGMTNKTIDVALRYKQSFFVDWRVLDKHKMNVFNSCHYFIDTNKKESPKMITKSILDRALKKVNNQPFRVVPFFDPGPWGGQWLKEVIDLDRSTINYAWGFDCVPEENSILLGFGSETFETPAINLVLREAPNLLGKHVYEKFGAEFPIRFDFLDTVDGGNLSLQVHPSNEYIKEQFGMKYTQDESYYLLDAKEDAVVYLGLKENIEPEVMIKELKEAQEDDVDFDADKHVAKWPIKKHDHVLIPAGTVHCSGKNSVVLEISATPYIFTFKLWDWGRLDLNNKPRPINISRGEKVIKWDRKEEWTKNNLINQVEVIAEGDGWVEEKTGLHDSGFIETRRHWFTDKVSHKTGGSVNVLNLIEGREAIVESPTNAFEPFVVHYAETFIVPASVGVYTIRPHGVSVGQKCGTIKAYVRNQEN